MLQHAEITSIILYMLDNKKYLTLFSTVWAQRIKNKVLGRNCKCFISKKKQTTASINLTAVRQAMHTLGTLNENSSTSFFASSQISEMGTWRQPFITSRSKMRISATQRCKRSHHSLIFPPSNSLLANYCTAVFLRAMQNADRGGLKESGKETQESSFKSSHVLSVAGWKE